MSRGLISIFSIILLLSTSLPIPALGQDNDRVNSISAAIDEAQAAVAEAEEAIAIAAEEGADTEEAEAYLNEARASLELAIARGEDGGEDALFLANEAREFAAAAKNIADEERNSILNQRRDEPVGVVDREVQALEIRERLFLVIEELEAERRELAYAVEQFDGDVSIGDVLELLRYLEEILFIAREDVDLGKYDLAEIGIHNAQVILERVHIRIGEIERDLNLQANSELADHLLLLVRELDAETDELRQKIETMAIDRDGEALMSVLTEVSVILLGVREDIEFSRFDRAEHGIHNARELLESVRRELVDNAVEIDIRHEEFERLLHFIEEKLAFFEDLLEERGEDARDVERAKAMIMELNALVREAIDAFEENDMVALDRIFRKALELVESLQAFVDLPPEVKDIASESIERYFVEVKQAISESRRELEAGNFANPDEAEEAIRRAEDLLEQARRALNDGRSELAFELLEEAYQLLKHRFRDQMHDHPTVDVIIARINRIIEKIGSIEKAVDDSLDRRNTGEIMLVLLEIRELVSQARRAVANGNLEVALQYTEDGEHLIEKLLEKISHIRESDQDGDPLVEAEELREIALRLMKEASDIGVNVRGVEALVKVGDEALTMASAFANEGNGDAARSLARIATKIYREAGDLAEHIMEVAAHTEIVKLRSLEERNDSKEIIVDNNGRDIEVQEIGGDSRHVAKIGATIPRITYDVTSESGREVEFSSIIRSLVEFEDRDGDGKIQDEEIIQILRLDDIEWTVSQEEEIIGEDSKVIKVTYSAESLNYAISLVLRVYESVSIEFFRSDEKTVVYSVDGGAKEVKFDLILTRWPWQSADSHLAMRMDLEGEVDEGEVLVDEVNEDENRLVLSSQGVDLKVKWITKASLEQVDGLTRIIDVVMAHEIDEGELMVDFIYPNFDDAALIHDPSIGLLDPVPDPEPELEAEPQLPQIEPPGQIFELPDAPEVEVENFYRYTNPIYLVPIGIGLVALVVATLFIRRRAAT